MTTTQTRDAAGATYAVSPDGTTIGARRTGAGSPIVLVHGAAADGTRWAPIVARLSESHTVYTVDRRGRGLSGDAADYSIEREYEDVVAFVESLGEPAVLLGHSYGAMLALEAARRTDSVEALVLYEPPFPVGLEIYDSEVVARLDALLAAGDREALLATFMREVPRVPEPLIETMRGQATWDGRVAAAHTIPRELRAVNAYSADIRERFAGLSVPTLLLLGGASPAFLTQPSRVLAETLADSRTVTFPGHMHSAMDTATDAFAARVLEFAAAPHERRGAMTAVVNDVRLAVDEAGSGEPLVLVHGSWADRSGWALVTGALAERYRVISYDRRGHSDSEAGDGPDTRRADEDDLAALIEGLCQGSAHVVANSFGGSIALGLAARRPGLFRSLTVHEPPLIGLVAHDPEVIAFNEAMGPVRATIERGENAAAARAFVESVLGEGAWEMLPAQEQERSADNAPTFAGELDDPEAWALDLDALREAGLPVLLTQGDQSPAFFRKVIARVAEAVPAAEVRTLDGCGHVPHLTNPAEYLALVTATLAGDDGGLE